MFGSLKPASASLMVSTPVRGSAVSIISATASRRGLLIANITIAAASRLKTTARSNIDDHHGSHLATTDSGPQPQNALRCCTICLPAADCDEDSSCVSFRQELLAARPFKWSGCKVTGRGRIRSALVKTRTVRCIPPGVEDGRHFHRNCCRFGIVERKVVIASLYWHDLHRDVHPVKGVCRTFPRSGKRRGLLLFA